MVNKIFIQVEDIYGTITWKEVGIINLGSIKNPNKEVLQVKIIT